MTLLNLNSVEGSGFGLSANEAHENRPYIATSGPNKGKAVVSYLTGQMDETGHPVINEKLVANATLRYDEWVKLEDQLRKAARERLVIVSDLMSMGLTYNVGGLGTMVSEWEESSEMTDANIDMDGNTKREKDGQEFDVDGVPIPVIHKEFEINSRMLMSSARRGESLDVTRGEEAARAVARTSENLIFNGSTVRSKGSDSNVRRIYGLLNHPNRAIQQISDWSSTATTAETILTEILAQIKELETEQRCYGPFNLYIPGEYAFQFRRDLKANSDKTLMERVLEIPEINAVRISDKLTVGNTVMVEMTKRTIDLAIASDITTIQWQSGNKWVNEFQVYAAWAPRIKKDYDNRVGFLHASTST